MTVARASLALSLFLATGSATAADSIPPEAPTLRQQGDEKRASGDLAGAIDAYLSATWAFDGYAEAWEAIGEIQFGLKQYVEAAPPAPSLAPAPTRP